MNPKTKDFFEQVETEMMFERIKKSGMLWVYYPESSGSAKEYLAERQMWLDDSKREGEQQ